MYKLVAVVLLAAAAAAEDIEYHVIDDDNFDFMSVSKEEFRDMVRCLTDEGPCSSLLASIRKLYPAAVEEGCRRCNPSQKRIASIYYDRVAIELPEDLEKIKRKYDPKGIYWAQFIKNLKSGAA